MELYLIFEIDVSMEVEYESNVVMLNYQLMSILIIIIRKKEKIKKKMIKSINEE